MEDRFMIVAVTGGTGFIGRWVLGGLSAEYDFVVLGRDTAKKTCPVNGKEYAYVPTDYSIHSLIEGLKGVSAVIHLAGRRADDKRIGERFDSFHEDISISERVFEACRLLGIRNIVSVSSIAAYSCLNRLPWSEEESPAPMTLYGISRVTVENLASYYNNIYSMCIKTLRLAQVVGSGCAPGSLFMDYMAGAASGETLNIYGQGRGRREYIYIRDAVSAIRQALRTGEKGIYNIGTGVNTSYKELAEIINDVFDNRGSLVFQPRIDEDKSVYLMDIKKAHLDLKWTPVWLLRDALHDMKSMMGSPEFAHTR
jgi:UDP-glucose 4-epimerase